MSISTQHNNDTLVPSTGTLNLTGAFIASSEITAYSDVKIKANIEVIQNALSKLMQIRGVTYDRTDIETKRQMGVIAQEVQAVAPEVITATQEGLLSVAYGNLVGLLIEAVKELKVENDSLKSRIEQLEAK